MSEKLQSLLTECEAEIRAGRAQRAAHLLARLNVNEVPRELRLTFANLARRAGSLTLGLRLLTPLIHRDRNRWRDEATAAERAEYAVLLQYCGAVREALAQLEQVDARAVPEAQLYRAFCHFNRWEYAEAIPCLEAYLRGGLSPYAGLVGRVNLAAALVAAEENDRARALLEENIRHAADGGHARLRGNSLELRAQLHLRAGDYAAADADLEAAAALFSEEQTTDRLYVRKWQAVTASLRQKDRAPLLAFREEARRHGNWESVREADLFLLQVEFEPALFEKLIFGTPYPSYRRRITKLLRRWPENSEFLHGSGPRVFDLVDATLDGQPILNSGKKIHRALEILSRDLYAPLKLGGLFAELFPGDHFDVNSSPDRVHQVLRRTRRWIEEHGLPLNLRAREGGDYALEVAAGLALRVPLHRPDVSPHALDFEKLRRLVPGDEFSPRDARAKLNLSLTGFNQLINWSLERGLVTREGRGRAVRYRRVA